MTMSEIVSEEQVKKSSLTILIISYACTIVCIEKSLPKFEISLIFFMESNQIKMHDRSINIECSTIGSINFLY